MILCECQVDAANTQSQLAEETDQPVFTLLFL